MRIRVFLALTLSVAVTSACGDGVTGPGSKETITLDFCAAEVPVWFAIQNETEQWQAVPVDAAGTVTFAATRRVSIAYVTEPSADDFVTDILNVSRAELEAISGLTCSEFAGTKTLSGTVSGLTGGQVAQLSMSFELAEVTTTHTSYSFANLPARPLDLVATRFPTVSTQPPDRVIVRRDLNLQSGATIPALDFGSPEAQPFASNTVTFSNRGTERVNVFADFISANGTFHRLMQFTGVSGNASVFVSVPQPLRHADDLHLLSAFASGAVGTREVAQFYAAPSDRTLTFGPELSTPTFTTLPTPYIRPRLTVASQPEYGAAMQGMFSQLANSGFRIIRILTTANFVGGRPATWELEMPDLSAVGYASIWTLQQPTSSVNQIGANARGYDVNVDILLGAAPSDGDVVRSAIRFASNVHALRLRIDTSFLRAQITRRVR